MIPIQTESTLTFPLKVSEPSSPAKPNFPLINFYDLLKSKNLSGSSMSTTDDFSIRTDDDTTKSLLGFESVTGKSSKGKGKKNKIPESQQTLKQIVSKRGDSKIIKCIDDLSPKCKDTNNKKRIMDIEQLENQEQMIKKRMLENGEEIKPIHMKPEDSIEISQIIFKDGKVQVCEPNKKTEESKTQVVEAVSVRQKRVTSSSFKKNNQAEKWAVKETRKFYRGLELFGTDFSMIARLFQNRNRNQIKNKFLKEEKVNPEKVEATFKKAQTINFASLKRRLEKKAGKIPSRKVSVESIIQRSERSGSFHSVTSLDSIDMSIMEDLAEAFVPTKQLTLLAGFGEQRLMKGEANMV